MSAGLPRFDGEALFAELDARRLEHRLSWPAAADAIWAQSAELNADRPGDHPISPATLRGIERRGTTSCQHALFVLRWLHRLPEDFLTARPGGPPVVSGRAFPAAGSDRRLRWHLHARPPRRPQDGLYEALAARREESGFTWAQLAERLELTPSQLSGLRRARFAIAIGSALAITQWLERPAADFVYAARW